VNLFLLECEPGLLSFESFEPYTMRYLKFMVLDGGGNVEDIYLREYCNPDTGRSLFAPDDTSLRAIFEAARETLRQNAVDLLTDCPSRERAGWLCDSFFSARAAWLLTGSTSVEHNFLENYLLPERFEHLPEGMLPMCYPADHDLGNFIPNWALWFILQVEEYLERSGDVSMVAQLRNRVQAVLWYLENFENDSGLLENLESWVFVEWSQANEFTEGVHYPTNMLYGAALSAAGRLYSSPDLVQKGYRVRETVRLQSFDGRWFVDNAVREEGKLRLTENRSEICQAYALYFDVVTPNGEAAFWDLFVRDLGPRGRKSDLHPEIARANALNGYILRLELLARHGLHRQCLEEMRELYEPMVSATGTLWEHVEPTASCCHGFQSFVACLLFESARALALPSLAGGS
jgi:alpha-L-rhamnosidase